MSIPSGPQPLVSILTPSYEQGEWLADNLHSVACQTYANVEHIVVDGGSTDTSIEVLERAGDTVVWKSEPDRGQCDALNKAFAMSRGEIIGWLNSDDAYFDCGVVQRVVDAFMADPKVDVVYGHGVRIAADGRIVWIIWTPRFSRRLMRWMNFIVQPTAFVRRSALPDYLVDEAFDFTMDWELWLRLGRDHVFKRLDSVLAADRYQPRRKNLTAQHVFAENELRLAPLHVVGHPREPWWRLYRYWYVIRQRFAGYLHVKRVVRADLAFDGYLDSVRALSKRQRTLRRSKWEARDFEAA